MATGKALAAATAMVVLATTPGCIVYDIRDQMVSANNRLLEVKFELARTNQELSEVNASLATSNQTLTSMEKRLDILDSINKSLASLDESLKVVRSVVEKVPFLGSSKEDEKKLDVGKPETPGSK